VTSPEEDALHRVLDLQVPATIDGMDVVHTALDACWSSLAGVRPLEQRWRDEFSLAVAEVAANIIQHAHAPDPPLVEFTLLLAHAPDHLMARFVDVGIVATPPETPIMPSVTVSYDELGERGRGLALVQMTADRFHYQRTASGENVWVIAKSFPG
jgi:serine/threonine-protein kinase RsbW